MLIRSLLIWLSIIARESLHGSASVQRLQPLVGDLSERGLAVFTGSLLILTVAWFGARWTRPVRASQALGIGAKWVGLTIGFELALGRLVMKLPRDRVAEAPPTRPRAAGSGIRALGGGSSTGLAFHIAGKATET